MTSRVTALALLLLAGCTSAHYAEHAREQMAEPPKRTLVGTYTTLRCYFENELPCQQALEVAEASAVAAAKFIGVSPDPAQKLEIDFITERKQFNAANEDLDWSGKITAQHKGFTNYKAMSIFLLCDSCLSVPLRSVGLTGWDRSSIAHEVLHLTRGRHVTNMNAEGDWIQEGAATSFEEQFMRARGELGPAEEASTYMGRIVLAQKLIEKNHFPTVDEIIHGMKGWSIADQYSIHWLFYRFMLASSHAQAFASFIDFADTAPLARGYYTLNTHFADHFNMAALSIEFRTYVESLRPAWRTQFGLETMGTYWLTVGGARGAASTHQPTLGVSRYAISGEFAPAEGSVGGTVSFVDAKGKPCMRVRLYKNGDVRVGTPDAAGKVTSHSLFDPAVADEVDPDPVPPPPKSATPAPAPSAAPAPAAPAPTPAPAPPTPIEPPVFVPFRLELGATALQITLGAKSASVPIPSCTVDTWLIGAPKGNIALWHKVTMTPLP